MGNKGSAVGRFSLVAVMISSQNRLICRAKGFFNMAKWCDRKWRMAARCFGLAILSMVGGGGAGGALAAAAVEAGGYFQIQVVDDQTGRGVPLVELETVNHLRMVTDSAGRVAFFEPGLMNQSVFFQVRSHGYEFPKDGFGYRGARVNTVPGGKSELRIKRLNLAERLYRITGEGIYRDTVLLGEKAPLREPLGGGLVVGQDSALAVPYRDWIYWFWGDTSRLSYPLGHFWTAGATAEAPGRGGLDPAQGIDLRYFTGSDGFSRPMARLGVKAGLILLDGLLTVADDAGRLRLVAHYAHMESLAKMLDHGLAIYNDQREEFERLVPLEMGEKWRFPRSHPVRRREQGLDFLYFGDPLPNVRVRAELKHLANTNAYEAWTCLAAVSAPGQADPLRTGSGQLHYQWRTNSAPMNSATEKTLIAGGKMKPEEAWFRPVDVDSGRVVEIHGSSVRWNAFRQRWVLLGVQQKGDSSYLGEVWYGEASQPTGPWRRVKKIVTHDKYTFYNPVHHDFLDQEGGRLIYFEGTYANTFSGNPEATPRYDYNQVMYRLDLADPRLDKTRE